MIIRVGRAEALAACALVVAAGEEPSRGLGRLAGEDPGLRQLAGVARACARGVALPEALRHARLLSRLEAQALTGLPPAALAQELGRCARARAEPLLAPHLARWLPAYLVAAACAPSLLIASAVELVAHQSYPGLWTVLGWQAPALDGSSLAAHVATCAAYTLVVALVWWLLRQLPVVRHMTYIDRSLEQADQVLALLSAARAHPTGTQAVRRYRRFAWFVGQPGAVLRELEICGGQVDATLMTLAIVPRQADGQPDWAQALREAEAIRLHRARRALPWLLVPLSMAGVAGLLGGDLWSPHGLDSLIMNSHMPSWGLGITVVASLLLAYLLGLGRWCAGWIEGPAAAWPLVADRLARALERREDRDEALESLRLWVHPCMRARLEDALLEPEPDPHTGRWLADAGVIPRLQAELFRAADSSCLPDVLRSIGERPMERHLGQSMSQMVAVLLMLALLLTMQFSWMHGLEHFFSYLSSVIRPNQALGLDYLHAGFIASLGLAGLLAAVLLVHAGGRRWGWSMDHGTWRRVARGLIIRRLLLTRADERRIAEALAQVDPRHESALRAAGEQGDLPAVLRLAGWPRSTAGSLDADLASLLRRHDRRWSSIDVALRILLPLLLAVPVGCTAIGIFQGQAAISRFGLELVRNHGDPQCNAASISGALLYWWCARCDEQGQAVVEEMPVILAPGPVVVPVQHPPSRHQKRP